MSGWNVTARETLPRAFRLAWGKILGTPVGVIIETGYRPRRPVVAGAVAAVLRQGLPTRVIRASREQATGTSRRR